MGLSRRDFIKFLGICAGLAATGGGVLADTAEASSAERYRATVDLPSHGVDTLEGGFELRPNQDGAINTGDIIVRLGHVEPEKKLGFWWERFYNETQDSVVWFVHAHGFWSDRKADCHVIGGLPTWFERV